MYCSGAETRETRETEARTNMSKRKADKEGGEVSNLSSRLLATWFVYQQGYHSKGTVYAQVSFMAAGANQVKPSVAILSSSVKQPHLPDKNMNNHIFLIKT